MGETRGVRLIQRHSLVTRHIFHGMARPALMKAGCHRVTRPLPHISSGPRQLRFGLWRVRVRTGPEEGRGESRHAWGVIRRGHDCLRRPWSHGRPDAGHSADKPRLLRIERSILHRVLAVAYTQGRRSHGEAIRSISAPRASDRERTAYGRAIALATIDCSNIPERSDEQVRTMCRVGRPRIEVEARQPIATRPNPEVVTRFRTEVKRLGIGYQTLMHRELTAHAGAEVV